MAPTKQDKEVMNEAIKKKRKTAPSSSSSGPSYAKKQRPNESDDASMLIASNFARSIHNILATISNKQSEDLPMHEFHFDSGGSKLVPVSEINKNVSTNSGVHLLIQSLITAENEEQIKKVLERDFTSVASSLPKGDTGGGCGAGCQMYIKGDLVLTIGAGGGGGYTISHHDKTLERGGGGGASIFIPGDEVSEAHIGVGHGLVDAKKGRVELKYDIDHDTKTFLRQLKKLKVLLSKTRTSDIAVLGGGGGGGGETEILRLRSQGEKHDGSGYGFGFQIGSLRAIKLAKLNVNSGRPKRTIMAPERLNVSSFQCGQSYDKTKDEKKQQRNNLNLPDHLMQEEWAIKMNKYVHEHE